jgi:hypothetical protein
MYWNRLRDYFIDFIYNIRLFDYYRYKLDLIQVLMGKYHILITKPHIGCLSCIIDAQDLLSRRYLTCQAG